MKGINPLKQRGLLLWVLAAMLVACDEGPLMEIEFEKLEQKGEVYLHEGKPFTGIARATQSDGSPKGEYPMRKGRLHGVVREWWENGQQSVETHFQKGVRHGNNTYWNQEGKITKRQVYQHGKSVSVEK